MLRLFGQRRPIKKPFYGWWIVLAGLVTDGFSSGVFFYVFCAFFDPIVQTFGWSRATASVGFSIQRVISGFAAIPVGFLVDRYGPRRVMLAGTLIEGSGFIVLSLINSLWMFYFGLSLVTLGLALGGWLVITTSTSNWFLRKRARALGIMSIGAAVIGGPLVPIVIWLISAYGWRPTLVMAGIGVWAVGIPASMIVRSRPEHYGYLPDGRDPEAKFDADGPPSTQTGNTDGLPNEADFTAKEAMGTLSFWQMSLAMSLGGLAMASSVHQIPALSSFGISREITGLAIAVMYVVSLGGTLAGGFLGDLMEKRYLLAASLILQALGTLIFANISSVWHLALFGILWGTGFGMYVPLRFALLGDYFGRRHYGSIMGVSMGMNMVSGLIAPVFVGWMFDVTESYRLPYLLLSAAMAFSVPLIATTRRPRLSQVSRPPMPSA